MAEKRNTDSDAFLVLSISLVEGGNCQCGLYQKNAFYVFFFISSITFFLLETSELSTSWPLPHANKAVMQLVH